MIKTRIELNHKPEDYNDLLPLYFQDFSKEEAKKHLNKQLLFDIGQFIIQEMGAQFERNGIPIELIEHVNINKFEKIFNPVIETNFILCLAMLNKLSIRLIISASEVQPDVEGEVFKDGNLTLTVSVEQAVIHKKLKSLFDENEMAFPEDYMKRIRPKPKFEEIEKVEEAPKWEPDDYYSENGEDGIGYPKFKDLLDPFKMQKLTEDKKTVFDYAYGDDEIIAKRTYINFSVGLWISRLGYSTLIIGVFLLGVSSLKKDSPKKLNKIKYETMEVDEEEETYQPAEIKTIQYIHPFEWRKYNKFEMPQNLPWLEHISGEKNPVERVVIICETNEDFNSISGKLKELKEDGARILLDQFKDEKFDSSNEQFDDISPEIFNFISKIENEFEEIGEDGFIKMSNNEKYYANNIRTGIIYYALKRWEEQVRARALNYTDYDFLVVDYLTSERLRKAKGDDNVGYYLPSSKSYEEVRTKFYEERDKKNRPRLALATMRKVFNKEEIESYILEYLPEDAPHSLISQVKNELKYTFSYRGY